MNAPAQSARLDYLDAVRAFALLLGVVFHASLSFMPMYIGWAVMDVSTISVMPGFVLICHSFRMELFFLLAGYFSHMTFHKRGPGPFLKSRFNRIAIPFVVAWFILRPFVVSGWIMGAESLRGDVHILGGLAQGFLALETLPVGIFTGTHLWFLYYLALATATTVLATRSLSLFPVLKRNLHGFADKALSAIARNSSSAPILAVPTSVCLYFMSGWGMDTPDKSLVPHLPAYFVYVGGFSLGWLIHRQPQLLTELSRLKPVRVLNIFGSAILTLYLARYQPDAGHPFYQQLHVAFAYSYGVLMWSLVFGTIGCFRLVFAKPNKIVRYFADSSYWLYLVHLPIVVWLQIAFAELPYHGSIKLVAISTLAVAAALLVYDLAIRPTFIGKILSSARKPSLLTSLFQPPTTQVANPARPS